MAKKRQKLRTTKQVEPAVAPKESPVNEPLNDDLIAAAICSIPQVFMKVCRLCETKDGPFLNIFDADKVTAKKIEEVMPFGIAENDDLPHKICFRCCSKVEELFEFVQKCIKTQENLRTAMGKKGPLVTKTKTRALWEEKLNKTNLSNDDICDALIKKAMEGIKDIPLNPLPAEREKPQTPTNKKGKTNSESLTSKKDKEPAAMSSKTNITYQSDEEPDEVSLKQVQLAIGQSDDKAPVTRSSRSNKSETLPEKVAEPPRKYPSRKSQSKVDSIPVTDNKSTKSVRETESKDTTSVVTDDKSKDKSDTVKPEEVPAKEQVTPPPINIMDHVSTIKVNGVGILFLCKLCNRNFLKKEVVLTHGCAKNNVPKDSFMQNHTPPPEVPKPPTVKYIKMDKDFKKPVMTESKPTEKKPVQPDCIRVNIPVQPVSKLKAKARPGSKTKAQAILPEIPKEPTPPPTPTVKSKIPQEEKLEVPSVQFPGLPSLNSRYKLVPGPNNTFTLVEDANSQNEEKTGQANNQPAPSQTKGKKRKTNSSTPTTPNDNQYIGTKVPTLRMTEEEHSPEVIDLDDNIPPQPPPIIEQPYPVGLFQTVPHHSGVFAPNRHPQPPAFATPAMKKQSYTIVQTGNPSKLLISTKPQPVVEEPSRKKSKKSKPEVGETGKEPHTVNLEENAPPKDAGGFFTFINVDPLVQPSYVLPTDNIIQESQITTSTPASKGIIDNKDRDKYSCNLCKEKFSREKKLLAHIQSHYNQMDEEDQVRAEKTVTKRKSRKS